MTHPLSVTISNISTPTHFAAMIDVFRTLGIAAQMAADKAEGVTPALPAVTSRDEAQVLQPVSAETVAPQPVTAVEAAPAKRTRRTAAQIAADEAAAKVSAAPADLGLAPKYPPVTEAAPVVTETVSTSSLFSAEPAAPVTLGDIQKWVEEFCGKDPNNLPRVQKSLAEAGYSKFSEIKADGYAAMLSKLKLLEVA